jgi:glycosyltransferase involved in cell wall biosynthesis
LDQFIEINGKAPKKTATLSVCLIIRDEEKTIERAIASIKPVADEIIVVDTGSNDRSAEIAASIGARIYDFPWADDFSAARNFAISKSTCDYIFMLDGDEYISPFFYIESQTFKSLLPLGKPCAFSVSIGTYFNETDWLFLVTEQGNFRTECSSVRFFPRMTGLAFREKIVESIEQTLLEKDVPVHVIPMNVLQIVHDHDNRNARIKRKVPIYEMIDNPGEKIILAAIRDISSIGRTQETIKWLRTYYSNQTGITEKIKMGIHLAGLLASSDLLQADNLYRDLIRTYPESTDLISAYIGFLITNNRIAEIAGLELPDSPLKDKNASFQIGCIRSLQHFEAGDQEKAFEILIEHLDANAYELFPQAIRFYYMASLNNIEGVVSSLDTLFTLIGKRKDFHINQIEDIFAMVEELYTSMCKSAYRTECSLILYGITILGLTWGVS